MSSTNLTSKKISRFIVGLFTKNIFHKLAALALAFFAWFTVHSLTGKTSTIADVELRVQPPDGYVVLNGKLPDITLELRGSQEVISQSRPYDFKVEYRISPQEIQANSEIVNLMLEPRHVTQAPRGVMVTGIEPKNVRVMVDRSIAREKPVRVVLTGELPEGYTATATTIPPSVPVTGPEGVLRVTPDIPTIPILLDRSITETFTVPAHPVDIPNPHIISPVRQVEVTVNVRQTSIHRVFPNLPVYLLTRNAPAGASERSISDRVNVRLSGPQTALNALSPSYIRVFADLSDLGSADDQGNSTVPLRCWCADPKVNVVSIEPAVITLKTAPAK